VRRVRLGEADVDLALRTSPEVVELVIGNPGAPATLTFRPALAPGVTVRAVEVGARPLVGERRGGPYEITVSCPPASTTRITLHLTRPPG
jgi:hypothetical protein